MISFPVLVPTLFLLFLVLVAPARGDSLHDQVVLFVIVLQQIKLFAHGKTLDGQVSGSATFFTDGLEQDATFFDRDGCLVDESSMDTFPVLLSCLLNQVWIYLKSRDQKKNMSFNWIFNRLLH